MTIFRKRFLVSNSGDWVPQYKGENDILQRIQKRATEVTNGLEYLCHEKRLRKLRLLSLRRRHRRDLINPYKYLNREHNTNRVRLFSMVPSERTRGKGH